MKRKIAILVLSILISTVWSEKVIGDLFPLAPGNFWEFSLKTGGTLIYSVIGTKKDSILFAQQMNSSGYKSADTFAYISSDNLGLFNYPLERQLSMGIWGPHCGIPAQKTITTEAGSFNLTFLYPSTWGHMSGGNRSIIVSPGTGPVTIAWALGSCEQPPCLDTFAHLRTYNIVKTPQAVNYSIEDDNNGASDFTFTYYGGDSGSVTYRVSEAGCEKYILCSSYNAATRVIRVYEMDTAMVMGELYFTRKHTLKLQNLKPGEVYTFIIFRAYIDPTVDIYKDKKYNLKTSLMYSKQVTCEAVSVNKKTYPTAKLFNKYTIHDKNQIYTLTGRRTGEFYRTTGNLKGGGTLVNGVYFVNHKGRICKIVNMSKGN